MHVNLFGEETISSWTIKKPVKNPSGKLFGRTLKLTLKVATCKRNLKSDFVKHLSYWRSCISRCVTSISFTMQLSCTFSELQVLRLPVLQRPRYNSGTSVSSPPCSWPELLANDEPISHILSRFSLGKLFTLVVPTNFKVDPIDDQWEMTDMTWSQWSAFQTRLNQNAIMKSNENTDVFRFAPLFPTISGPKLIPVFFLFVFPLKSVQPMEGSGEADGREETNIWVKTTGKRRQTIERFLLRLQFSRFISLSKCWPSFMSSMSVVCGEGGQVTTIGITNSENQKLNMGFILFCFRFFLQDWWHNPRLTTIRFRGVGIPYTKLKQNFIFVWFSNHFLSSSPPDRRLNYRK